MSIPDSIEALDRKVAELQTKVSRLEAQLEGERADKKAREEFQRLNARSSLEQGVGGLSGSMYSPGRGLPLR
jgi:phage shock protein A